MDACKLCRRELAVSDHITTFAAFGRTLFTVHTDPCAQILRDAGGLVGGIALKGAHSYLAVKNPKVLTVINRLQSLRARNPVPQG